MTKKITVPEKYQFRMDRIDSQPLSDTEKQLLEILNIAMADAYREGYAIGYRERGILTRLQRRLTRK